MSSALKLVHHCDEDEGDDDEDHESRNKHNQLQFENHMK